MFRNLQHLLTQIIVGMDTCRGIHINVPLDSQLEQNSKQDGDRIWVLCKMQLELQLIPNRSVSLQFADPHNCIIQMGN